MTGEIRRITYPVGAGVEPQAAGALLIATAAPTPSRGAVTLAWAQPRDADVQVTIVDAAGRAVRALIPQGRFTAGDHTQVWDGRTSSGSRCAPGIYFARVVTAGAACTARIVLSE